MLGRNCQNFPHDSAKHPATMFKILFPNLLRAQSRSSRAGARALSLKPCQISFECGRPCSATVAGVGNLVAMRVGCDVRPNSAYQDGATFINCRAEELAADRTAASASRQNAAAQRCRAGDPGDDAGDPRIHVRGPDRSPQPAAAALRQLLPRRQALPRRRHRTP